MNLKSPTPREAGASTPDVVLDVRDADLTPEVRALIANVHAQIKAVTDRYGVKNIAELQQRLTAGTRTEKLAAKNDVVLLAKLTQRLQTLVQEHAVFGEAFVVQGEAEWLAHEALYGIATERVGEREELMTIGDIVATAAPFDLEMLRMVLEAHLLNGDETAAKELINKMQTSIEWAMDEVDDTLIVNEREVGQKAFALLGRYQREDDAQTLLGTLKREFRPYMRAAYAAGLAGAGEAEKAQEMIEDARWMVNTLWKNAVDALAHVGFSAAKAGLDGSRAFAEAERLIAAAEIVAGGNEDHLLSSDVLAEIYGELGDEERLTAAVGLADKWGIDTGSAWRNLAITRAKEHDFEAAQHIIRDTIPRNESKHRLVYAVMLELINARNFSELVAWQEAYQLSVADLVGSAKNFEQHRPMSIEDAEWLFERVVSDDDIEAISEVLTQRLWERGDLEKLQDMLELMPDAYKPATLYRLGRKTEAKELFFTQRGPSTYVNALLLAQAVHEAGDNAAGYIADVFIRQPDRYPDVSTVRDLVQHGLVDYARTWLRKKMEDDDAEAEDPNAAWQEIGEWYAREALKKATAAHEVLQKLDE